MLTKVLNSYSKETAKGLVMALVAGLLGTGVAVVGSAVPATAAACSTTALGYAGGDGTSGNPYQISNASELIRLSTTTADWSGKYFVQTADINLGGCAWSPIGNGTTSFSGQYDGSFFKVSGFSIPSSSADYVGFFGRVNQTVIKNLTLEGSIVSDGGYVGGFVGYVLGPQVSTITQVKSAVDITYSAGNYAGGIVGELASGSVISFSLHMGNLSSSNQYGSIAGLTGFGAGSIESSYSKATFSGASTLKSGLSGWGNPTVRRSYSVGPGADGGISGLTLLSGSTNAFWDTSIASAAATGLPAGASDAAAIGKTSSQMKDVSTFSSTNWRIVNGWDNFSTAGWTNFSSTPPAGAKIWGICSNVNDGYPFLLWEYSSDPCITAPLAPTIDSVTAGNSSLSVAFTAGANGGSAITNYEYSTDNGATWTTRSPISAASPLVITGLTNGTSYQVRIRAVNIVGFGTQSAAESGTPVAPPSSGSGPSGSAVQDVETSSAGPNIIRQRTFAPKTDNRPARLMGKPLGEQVLFVADSARLYPEAKTILRKTARLAKKSDSRLAVTGFAAITSRGSSYEKRVAQRRALAVARYLRAQGVEVEILYHGLSGRAGLAFEGMPRRAEVRTLR